MQGGNQKCERLSRASFGLGKNVIASERLRDGELLALGAELVAQNLVNGPVQFWAQLKIGELEFPERPPRR